MVEPPFPHRKSRYGWQWIARDEYEGAQCSKLFPWIPTALEKFYANARTSAAGSKKTVEEGIQEILDVRWGTYAPGKDIVSLKYEPSLGYVNMSIYHTKPPNAAHKRPCILGVLEDAVQRHNEALHDLLGDRELLLTIETEDFPIMGRGKRLPAFSMCWDDGAIDIPIPDFTFKCYPEMRYSNTSWPAVAPLLKLKSEMLPWPQRRSHLSHRSNWGVGPRRWLMPRLQKLQDEGKAVEVLGAEVDVQNTEFVASSGQKFQYVDDWCNSKYLIHTAGFSYSAGLKYRMACGSLVFKLPSKWVEFYEPGIVAGQHYVELPAFKEGMPSDEEADEYLANVAAPTIKKAVDAAKDSKDLPAIALAGQKWVLDNLSEQGLSCYWFHAIQRYAQLYFDKPPAVEGRAEKQKAAQP